MAVDNPDTRSPGLAPESVPGPARLGPAHEFSLYHLDGPDAAVATQTSAVQTWPRPGGHCWARESGHEAGLYLSATPVANSPVSRLIETPITNCRPERFPVALLTVNTRYFTLRKRHIRGRREMFFQRCRRWSSAGVQLVLPAFLIGSAGLPAGPARSCLPAQTRPVR